ncbi:single-stranded-DNA-specific exonuclease RecJ, partial [Chlamydia psittaci 84-8471/1]
MRKCS